MDYKKIVLGILLVILFFSCKKEWKDHYNPVAKTVNMNVWEAIQKDANLSLFVQFVKKYNYDTLFLTDHTYTLFIPDNEAFAQYIDSARTTRGILSYNITEFYIQSVNIEGVKKIQTLGEKYALFNKTGSGSFLDGVPLKFESPLYLNGKYFIMDQIAYPKPNLYEYFTINNLLLQKYIDSKDSIILDKSKSRPLGFDAHGNTIYDTVSIVLNLFEEKYFPVKHESRYKTSTIVFPKAADYNKGLTLMAQALGGNYHDYHDIPLDWQNKILIPYLLEHGVFENMLEENEFVLAPGKDTLKLKNIFGDSVVIDYKVADKTLCSNGYAYNYANFKVPDTLWASSSRMEGEHLLRGLGVGRFSWLNNVTVSSNTSFAPLETYSNTASKDSFLIVNFTNNYTGSFSLEFNVDNLFPRKYLMVVRTGINYGGIYDIYVNGVLVKTIDYVADRIPYTTSFPSVLGKKYNPDGHGGINFDCWVNSLVEYGKAKIKFVYKGPSTVSHQALLIDYIDFIPY
jgi:hypothetical protein